MSEVPLQLNDPVVIEASSTSAQDLHGIVAYLGAVEFSDEAQDYVGIRLTGSSVGLGKNDGVVNGKRYFQAGPNGGVFVRYSSGKISKRTLSRLQELQLKRELAVSTANYTSSAASDTTLASPAPPATKTPTSSLSADKGAPSKSRLDDIRKRREAAVAATTMSMRSAKGSEDDASTTSSVSNSSGFTSPKTSAASKLAIAKTSTSKDTNNINVVSRLSELRSEREATRLSRNTPSKSFPFSPSPSSQGAKFNTQQLDEMTNMLKERDTEISQLKSALEKSKQMSSELQNALDSMRQLQDTKQASSPPNVKSKCISADADTESHQAEDAEKQELQCRLNEALVNITSLEQKLFEDKENHSRELSVMHSELSAAKSRALAAEREGQVIKEQFEKKSSKAADYLKERAKLTGEITALHRRVSDLQTSVAEYEASVEELALDKEALLEEKEELMDELQEKTIEITSLQIELEEAKVDIEEGKIALEEAHRSCNTVAVTTISGSEGGDTQETKKALSIQNDRLREALLRLREQTNIEKMELTKQLRLAEKDSSVGRELIAEVEALQKLKVNQTSEIRELKEIIDTQNAYEQMVEDLSDKVNRLEDENIELGNAIRDLEEAGEISQEMEEVQAELNKSLRLDVEKKDALIYSLEEAIKVQRRREDDLQRSIGNYRSIIDNLKSEKAALLAVNQGGEGEKSNLLAMSQRALAQASQAAIDQAVLRTKEAALVFDRINAQLAAQYSKRIEGILPEENFVAEEISAIKGEVLLSKIAATASVILSALEESFRKSPAKKILNSSDVSDSFELTDESLQQIKAIIYQGKYSRVVIDSSANCILWLCVGQWPELLSPDESRKLGSSVSASPASDVSQVLCQQLRTLKEEGYLSLHHSSSFIPDLEKSVDAMNTFLVEGGFTLPPGWQDKPSWVIIKEMTAAKYSSLATMSALSSAVSPSYERTSGNSSNETIVGFLTLRRIVDRIVDEIERAVGRLVDLPFDAELSLLTSISNVCKMCNNESSELLESVEKLYSNEVISTEVISKVQALAEVVLDRVVTLSSSLNETVLFENSSATCHPISPVNENPWDGVMQMIFQYRDASSSKNLIPFSSRASYVEQKLSNAILSEKQLAAAVSNLASLEKNLATRSQELAMQTERMAELEGILADGQSKVQSNADFISNYNAKDDFARLLDENRVLTEAVDVLQAQVDEYEAEIRALKEAGGRMHSRRSMFSPAGDADYLDSSLISALGQEGSESGSKIPMVANSVIKLEAALFRPALKMLCAEVGLWKGKVIENKIATLPPLIIPNVPAISSLLQPQEGEGCPSTHAFNLLQCKEELLLATAQFRLAKANVAVVDVCKSKHSSASKPSFRNVPSRRQLGEQRRRDQLARKRLEDARFAALSLTSRLSGIADLGLWIQ